MLRLSSLRRRKRVSQHAYDGMGGDAAAAPLPHPHPPGAAVEPTLMRGTISVHRLQPLTARGTGDSAAPTPSAAVSHWSTADAGPPLNAAKLIMYRCGRLHACLYDV